MFVEATRELIAFAHQPGYSADLRLIEWIVEARPKVISRHPCSRSITRDVHANIHTVEVVIDDTCHQATINLTPDPDRRTIISEFMSALRYPLDDLRTANDQIPVPRW